MSEIRPVIASLIATADANGRSLEVGFIEVGIDPGPKQSPIALFSIALAGSEERVGDVLVSRNAFAPGSDRSLRYSAPGVSPETATLSLGKPFFGTATHRKKQGSAPTWTGTLGASFPGLGAVPLAGAGFRSSLCQATAFERFEACLTRLSERPLSGGAFLGTAQGSGSQSQLLWRDRLSWSR